MSPRALMILGATTGLFALALSFIGTPTSGTVVFIFAGGAVFGKGYGVWEERAGRSEERG